MNEWSEDELVAISKYATYREFVDSTGSTRTRQAWNSKRTRAGLVGPPGEASPLLIPSDTENLWDAYKQMIAAQLPKADLPTTHTWESPDDKWMGIIFLGDLHIGGLIDAERLEADLARIQATEGLYVVGMGDYGERFEHSGKIAHAMAGDPLPGSDDQETLIELILGQCDKWLALLAGNHDDWGGTGAVRRLAETLETTYVSQAGCSLKLSVGSERYCFYLKHQYAGGGRGTSNDGKRFWSEWSDFENADVTVLAHLHEPNTHAVERKGSTVIHLRGGTYKTIDPWARKGGYCPAYGPPVVLLNPHTHEVLPWHGPNWHHAAQYLAYLRRGLIGT